MHKITVLLSALVLHFAVSTLAQAENLTVTSLNYPGASFTSADDINASGTVVGQY